MGKEETGKMVVDSHYIQSVRQDLILKDVFVKYEEINIENIIGAVVTLQSMIDHKRQQLSLD